MAMRPPPSPRLLRCAIRPVGRGGGAARRHFQSKSPAAIVRLQSHASPPAHHPSHSRPHAHVHVQANVPPSHACFAVSVPPARSLPVPVPPTRPLPVPLIHHRLFSTTPRTLSGDSHSHSHFDAPQGWLFGVPPGQKYEKEGWEGIWVWGFWGSLIFGVVGYAYKPDTSIQTWALEEARRRLEIEGILEDPFPNSNSSSNSNADVSADVSAQAGAEVEKGS